ncbi:MAG: response regulator [Betaproteobacteria bacterium]|nr:response regulator [Betaproteobacteria bacterium]
MSRRYRLLMVEDSADDAELLQYSLRDAPFDFTAIRVETEPDYDSALAEWLPDVVLCDYHLPRFSANRALQILNERHLDIPFIVVSHHIDEDEAVMAMQNGASDYLSKSRLGRLPKAIEAAIERRISRTERVRAENALRTSEAMKRGILNSLNTRIAVLDGHGVIVATNKTWESFGVGGDQSRHASATVGTNYFDLLREAADRGDGLAEQSEEALRGVIDREASFTSMEYALDMDGGTRHFVARAFPLEDSTDGAVISHEDVTDRMLAHLALSAANTRLQAVSMRVLSIQEEERRRISRELHDDIGQSLTALKIGLHRLAQRANGEHTSLIAECLNTADTTLNSLRQLSRELRPPQLDQLGLADALEWLVDHQRSATGIDIQCQVAGLAERLPADLESVCYRIAQEALNNATRHAKATQIRFRLEMRDQLLKLVISDNGVGFDMATERRRAIRAGSLGLISMEERAQLAGGRFKVRTVPGEGTTIQVTFLLESVDNAIAGGNGEYHPTGEP